MIINGYTYKVYGNRFRCENCKAIYNPKTGRNSAHEIKCRRTKTKLKTTCPENTLEICKNAFTINCSKNTFSKNEKLCESVVFKNPTSKSKVFKEDNILQKRKDNHIGYLDGDIYKSESEIFFGIMVEQFLSKPSNSMVELNLLKQILVRNEMTKLSQQLDSTNFILTQPK
jgi:rubredoxin